ncbi:MAG: leucine-rich repeat domain-containing protein [Paludibacteraceae bacterium]|nr:leucine-rich repeat domain-containing protein [Paludibacteraceae bacterium]
MSYFDKYGVEFSDDRKTLIKCPKDFQGTYEIPNGVVIIARAAFSSCKDLISVKIPTSVERIEWGAFIDCINLSYMIIPENVSFLGHQAFENCENLRCIALPTRITHIGSSTFYHASWQTYRLQLMASPES